MDGFEGFVAQHAGTETQHFVRLPVPETGIVGSVAVRSALHQHPLLVELTQAERTVSHAERGDAAFLCRHVQVEQTGLRP